MKTVGHRGLPAEYPENCLPGLVAAAKAGASALELDVQFSSDGIPMVFHDVTLERVCARSGNLSTFTAKQLQSFSCHEPKRFGERYIDVCISTLNDVCLALAARNIPVFIEIKEESMAYIDRQSILERVFKASDCLGDKRILISFDFELIELAKTLTSDVVGWALREFDLSHKSQAENLKPAFLIIDKNKLSKSQTLWQGNWEWFIYDVVDPQEAKAWHQYGVEYIESWDVRALNNHPL
ncbi:MAG: glycerophosphodiester phosphodiesterase [Alteromonadaceae bacterium]|nr:MAG: glycerophosphodiester phosphodiesterase [Alteromonadaceae bacterium]